MDGEKAKQDAALILRLYEALHRITKYDSSERLHRSSEKDWGLGYAEALEYAYDNIQHEAGRAIHGVRIAKYRAALATKENERGR